MTGMSYVGDSYLLCSNKTLKEFFVSFSRKSAPRPPLW